MQFAEQWLGALKRARMIPSFSKFRVAFVGLRCPCWWQSECPISPLLERSGVQFLWSKLVIERPLFGVAAWASILVVAGWLGNFTAQLRVKVDRNNPINGWQWSKRGNQKRGDSTSWNVAWLPRDCLAVRLGAQLFYLFRAPCCCSC